VLICLLIILQIFLTSYGLDVNSQDVGGWSALHEAAYAGREDLIEVLLSSGANINIQNSDGATPIFTAAQYGNDSCLKLLLKNGADINLLTVDNASPLFIAAQEGLTSCINILLGASKCLLTYSCTWQMIFRLITCHTIFLFPDIPKCYLIEINCFNHNLLRLIHLIFFN